MTSKTFTFELPYSAASCIALAKEQAEQHRIQFNGDERAGACSGHGFSGQYTIVDRTITVTIDKKPMFIPWSLIEQKARAYLQALPGK